MNEHRSAGGENRWLSSFARMAMARYIFMNWQELNIQMNTSGLSGLGEFRHSGMWPHERAGGRLLGTKLTKLSPRGPSAMLVLCWLESFRNSQLTFSTHNINRVPLTTHCVLKSYIKHTLLANDPLALQESTVMTNPWRHTHLMCFNLQMDTPDQASKRISTNSSFS